MIAAADFDEVYRTTTPSFTQKIPECNAPGCFIASYPPVSKLGESGPFFVNSRFLQPNRYAETAGPVSVRSADFKC
jgi:hypothetical protein